MITDSEGLPVLLASAARFLLAALAWAPGLAVAENSVICRSDDGSRRHCEAYTDAGVALSRSIGSASCLLGRNWGYDATGVWVTEGCAAEFVLGNSAHEQQRLAAQAVSPETPTADDSAEAGRSLGEYKVYSRLGTQAAFTGGEAQVQGAGSRIGFRYEAGDTAKLFAAAEWSVKLTSTENAFYPGETTSSGFLTFETARSELFGNRLGFVGVDLGEWGRFALGKQWGVHYDVTSYTDRFNVFGAEASATFNGGTDGGFMGTGRADAALSYRNALSDRLEVGLQVQMRDLSNGETVDGYGASAQFMITESLKAGVTYTRAQYDDTLKNAIFGLSGDGEYAAVGLSYGSERLSLAGVRAWQKNGDIVRVPILENGVPISLPVAFDAVGLELFGRYELTEKIGLLGGYLDYNPDIDDLARQYVDPRLELEYYIVGIDYRWLPNTLMFAELRLAEGFDAAGERGDDVFVLGAQYWFRKAGSFELR